MTLWPPTCHGQVGPDRLAHGQGEEGCDDGAPRTGAILGGATCWYVDMQAVACKVAAVRVHARQEGAGKGVGYARALLHHVTQLPCRSHNMESARAA